jgi:peptide deformylase
MIFVQSLSIVTVDLETAKLPSICLRQKATDVPADVSRPLLRTLIEDMFACLYTAGGVGLAGPQVGVMWRLFLIDTRGRDPENPALMAVINPRIVEMSDETVEGREGCLSIPRYLSHKVPRAQVIRVEALNQHLEPITFEATQFLARAVQHEYDHLDGVLYLDRLKSPDDLELLATDPYSRALIAAGSLYNPAPVSDATVL